MMVALSATSLTYAEAPKENKLQALDVDFLLFIEQMERVEQGWIDPITLESISFEPSTKLEQSDKDMKTKHAQTNKTNEQSNKKGAK